MPDNDEARQAVVTDDTGPNKTIALIGYGRMGRPMGRRLIAAGHRLIAYDLNADALQAAEHDGSTIVTSPSEAATAAETVITMLPDSSATANASYGEKGILAGLQPGTLWIEMSSSHPTTTLELAQGAEDQQATLLDAPVSGGVTGAEEGTLTIMVGGASEVLERARPILKQLGRNVLHVGDRPGDGDLAKTINNLLSATHLTAGAEALTLGIRGGLDPARLLVALGVGSASSQALTAKIPKYVLSGKFDAGFTINQMLKDLRIVQDVATRLDVPSPVGSLIHTIWASFADEGHAADDHTTVAALIAAQAGVEIAPKQ